MATGGPFSHRYSASIYMVSSINCVWMTLYPDHQLPDGKQFTSDFDDGDAETIRFNVILSHNNAYTFLPTQTHGALRSGQHRKHPTTTENARQSPVQIRQTPRDSKVPGLPSQQKK